MMITAINKQSHFTHQPGSYLSSSRWLYRHAGIATDMIVDGQQTVISNSGKHGQVVEERLAEFCDGGDIHNHGYLGQLPYEVVLKRARNELGKGYSLFNSNCEHFVRYAHGLKEESPQVQNAVLAVGAFILLWGLART